MLIFIGQASLLEKKREQNCVSSKNTLLALGFYQIVEEAQNS